METITLTNEFHGTKVRLRPGPGVPGSSYQIATLSPSQVRRARRELCGIPDCTCGGAAGERGPQEYRGERVLIQPSGDGSAVIELL